MQAIVKQRWTKERVDELAEHVMRLIERAVANLPKNPVVFLMPQVFILKEPTH